jgi:hypothetical protein
MTWETEVTAYTGLGEGPHAIVVTGMERKVAKAGGDYIRWEFSDEEGKTASANSAIEITPGNKTGKWLAALTGRPVVVGEKRDPREAVGRPGNIFIEINPEGYPKVISVTGRQATTQARPPVGETVAASEATPAPVAAPGPSGDLPF